MWPPSDLDRIRSLILNARADGIRSQVDYIGPEPPLHVKKFVYIYETVDESEESAQDSTKPTSKHFRVDAKPQAIWLFHGLRVGKIPFVAL
jgi:hypothetical protein